MWQTLVGLAHDKKKQATAAVRVFLAAGQHDDDRVRFIASWPPILNGQGKPNTVSVPGAKAGSKSTDVDVYRRMFDQSPQGIEMANRYDRLKAIDPRNQDQQTEMEDIVKDRNTAIGILKDVKRMVMNAIALRERGYKVDFETDGKKVTYKPIRVMDEKGYWAPVAVSTLAKVRPVKGLSIAELVKTSQRSKGADDNKSDAAASTQPKYTKIEDTIAPLSGLARYMDDDGRMKFIRELKADHPAVAHMREVFFQLGDALAGKAGDKKGEVYAALATIKAAIPEVTVPVPAKAEASPAPAKAQAA
jgi:hypothetical protein